MEPAVDLDLNPAGPAHVHRCQAVGIQEDGRGIEAAVHHLVLMRVQQRARDLVNDVGALSGRELGVGQCHVQWLEVRQRRIDHHIVRRARQRLARAGRHDVLVIEPGEEVVLAAQQLAHELALALAGRQVHVQDTGRDGIAGILVLAVPEVEAGVVGGDAVVQEERAGELVPHGDPRDLLHGDRDEDALVLRDPVASGGLLNPIGDRRKAGLDVLRGEIRGVHTKNVVRFARREDRLQLRIVEEHRLLDPRHAAELRSSLADLWRIVLVPRDPRELLLKLGLESLGLAARGDQGGAHTAEPPLAVGDPSVLVAAQPAPVRLELQQVDAGLADHHRIDLVPLAVPVLELEVRPHPVRRRVGDRPR